VRISVNGHGMIPFTDRIPPRWPRLAQVKRHYDPGNLVCFT
jgi:hypothetical protein